MPYVQPKLHLGLFNCPLCQGYTEQNWHSTTNILNYGNPMKSDERLDNVNFCICKMCDKYTIWVNEKIVYPLINGAPFPHQDMPQEVKEIYEEARGILSGSPRSACALLRVSLEVLIDNIMEKNKRPLFQNIGVLVNEKKLPSKIQKAMDILRITAERLI